MSWERCRDDVAACEGCTVLWESLEYAVSAPETSQGIWGWTSDEQRRSMRRARSCPDQVLRARR